MRQPISQRQADPSMHATSLLHTGTVLWRRAAILGQYARQLSGSDLQALASATRGMAGRDPKKKIRF